MRPADEKFAVIGTDAPNGRGACAPSVIECACFEHTRRTGSCWHRCTEVGSISGRLLQPWHARIKNAIPNTCRFSTLYVQREILKKLKW